MKVQVCTGKSCRERFSKYVIQRLENDTKFYNWESVEIMECACMDHCKKWPNIKIKNQVYNYTSPAKASEIVLAGLKEEFQKKWSKKKK